MTFASTLRLPPPPPRAYAEPAAPGPVHEPPASGVLDDGATERWSMIALEPAPGYSAALVVHAPLGEVLQLAL